MLDSLGNCQNITIGGIYKGGTALDASNFNIANVNFAAVGNFVIYSDTVNGYYFYLSGYAYSTGNKQLTLPAFGTPALAIDCNFTLHFTTSVCHFKVLDNTAVANPATNNDYFPTTAISNWTYFNSTLNDTAMVTVIPSNKNILGTLYRQFVLSIPKLSQTDTLYYRKDGAGNYYRYYYVGNGIKTEYAFLKDWAAVGATWESPIVVGTLNGNPADVKYKFTIVDKDISATIGTHNIDSIINVREETMYFESGAFTTKFSYIYSYAKKIGLVDINQENAIPNLAAPIQRWQVY